MVYTSEIRKVIYTSNAIESLNSVIRKAIKQRKIFPTDDSAMNEGGLSRDPGSCEEMDDTNQELEAGSEPIYDRVW